MTRDQDEAPERRAKRLKLEANTAALGRLLSGAVQKTYGSKKVGFLLALYDFGEEGSFAYVADGLRKDLIASLRELADRLEVGEQAKSVAFRTGGKSS